MRAAVIWACQVALVLTGVTVVESALPASGQASAAVAATPDTYRPRSGVLFNDPYSRGGHPEGTIKNHIIRTINSTARGATIRIATWNLRGDSWQKALDNADNRGVTVQVVMGANNAPPMTPNPDVVRLRRNLADGNDKLRAERRSWLRLCDKSCRGYGGIAHSKFYLFDDVQGVNDVIMYGSANATQIAADDQWNDLYTINRRARLFDTFVGVFDQMSKDTAIASAYQHAPLERAGKRYGTIGFYPYTGAIPQKNPDPILRMLNMTRCTGATTPDHKTKVRIAQDALWGDRGLDIAERLAAMQRRGCDIKIVYTLFGNNVLRVLRKAKVPLVHLAYDVNRDGEYDHYLHMKVMAISGYVAGNRDARVVTNGSANWTELPLHSDEVTGELWDGELAHDYSVWINWMFTHRPADWVAPDLAPVPSDTVECDCRRVTTALDPYRLIRQDL